MQWTSQQLQIFAWFTLSLVRAMVIVARAGCGKSTTIVEGIKRLLAEAKASGKRIRVLATSFAKLSVNDLAVKLASYKDAGAEVKSINSLGNSFCMGKVGKLDNDNRSWNLARFVAPDAPDCVHACLAKLNSKARALCWDATSGSDLIELAERFELGPDEEVIALGFTMQTICDLAYEAMVTAAKYTHEYDFADQVFLPLRNGWVRAIYDRIVIDETQDLDPAQLMLVQKSVKDVRGICVVGDDCQAIYGFRGADTTALARLQQELSATELSLTLTRRCGKLIVEEARKVLPDHLMDFAASDTAPDGIVSHDQDIANMLDNAKPGDFILSRTNAPLVPLCLALIRRKVPAYVAGRDMGNTLVGIVNRMKAKSIDDLKIKLDAYTEKKVTKIKLDKRARNHEWLDSKLDQAGDEAETIMACADGCSGVPGVIGQIKSLFSPGPTEGGYVDMGPRVMLATCHKAKGLEADQVWLCDGTFKIRSHDDSMILYVAITRAKNALHFVKGFETKALDEQISNSSVAA